MVTTDGKACTAVSAKITNCEWYKSSGDCLACKKDFVLATDKKCVTLDTAKNCLAMASATACSVCKADYYLDTTCKAKTTAVANCLLYATATTCAACKSGHYKLDASNCKVLEAPCTAQAAAGTCTAIPNCKTIAALKCTVCNNGYKLASDKCVDQCSTVGVLKGASATECKCGDATTPDATSCLQAIPGLVVKNDGTAWVAPVIAAQGALSDKKTCAAAATPASSAVLVSAMLAGFMLYWLMIF